jgi:hypothetical protein
MVYVYLQIFLYLSFFICTIFQYIITNSDLQNVFLKAKTQKAILCELTKMSLKRNNSFDCKIFWNDFPSVLGPIAIGEKIVFDI